MIIIALTLRSVLHPHQHNIGYMGDGFYIAKRANQQYQSTKGKSTKDKSIALYLVK